MKHLKSSATRDRRFTPLEEREVPHATVGVSLLDHFVHGQDIDDWILGEHGVILEFEERKRRYKATFLPEVPLEQHWSKEDTIHALIAKSGYKGTITEELLEGVALTKYSTEKATMSYAQYREHRK